MNSTASAPTIRITKEDASSSHVDDLLKRQMSLRGEPGVTRDNKRKWYYQTWLILMIVGAAGAIAAWGVLEPFFADMLYYQGTITAINLDDQIAMQPERGRRAGELAGSVIGSITVRAEKFYLLRGTREIEKSGHRRRLDIESLKVGSTVGVYSQTVSGRDENFAFAFFVTLNPQDQRPAVARLTLDDLRRRSHTASLLFFAIVAGFIGLFIGAADGVICRLPRRALLCGSVGLVVGMVGGFVCTIAAEIAYAPLSELAQTQMNDASSGLSVIGFVVQIFGRSLAWGLAGVAMGLGQGIALRSKRLLIYGLIGGVLGGLLGGLLFDPIDLLLLGNDKPSAAISRLIGLAVIGTTVGAAIGIVELLARDAWLRMTKGPLSGKEFLLFKDTMRVGSSPRSDIYIFNDPVVAPDHALIRSLGDECEIETRDSANPVLLNNRSITRARLRHGDSIGVGRTTFVFQRRHG